MATSTVESGSRPKNSFLTKLSEWIIDNRNIGVGIGLGCILLGILIELISYLWIQSELYANPAYKQGVFGKSSVFISSHFFIIFGEATFALFFLQVVIEHKTSEAQRKLTKDALDQQKASVEAIFENLRTTYKTESEIVITQLRTNLFEAILGELLPHQIVGPVMKSSFFESEAIKKNSTLTYDFASKDDTVILRQTFVYTMENISKNNQFEFAIPLEVSDTVSSKSRFIRCSSQKSGDAASLNYNLDNDFLKTRDLYRLKDPIILNRGESVEICQVAEVVYDLSESSYISDYFYSMFPSVGVTLVFKLPDDNKFDFELVAAFPTKILPKPKIHGASSTIVYPDICFLAIGQGFTFVLEKKV